MSVRPWRQRLHRRLCRDVLLRDNFHPAILTLVVGLILAWSVIQGLEVRLRPVVETVAQTQIQNTITVVIEETVRKDLTRRGVSYASLVDIQRENDGRITSLTTDMAALNLLRNGLMEELLETLGGMDVSTVQIPLGSLFDSELVWARGPTIYARAMSVGTVSAEFQSEFSSAGVNQTLHRIWLKVSVPITVLLPGSRVEAPVESCLCIAETIIVGQVPDTYLNLGASG